MNVEKPKRACARASTDYKLINFNPRLLKPLKRRLANS